MDEHRDGEIALGKPDRDHRQMLTNSRLAFRISGFVAVNLNSTTVSKKMEMMSCFLVTKTHTLIATSVYTLRMFVLRRRRLLSCRAKTDLPKYQHEEEVTKFHTLILVKQFAFGPDRFGQENCFALNSQRDSYT